MRRQEGERLAWGRVWGQQAPGVRGGQRVSFRHRQQELDLPPGQSPAPLSAASPLDTFDKFEDSVPGGQGLVTFSVSSGANPLPLS